ncbi:MAG: tRNA (adenosine(37)-N6)-threonylcarbamoyltransferase complex dimerization subunit type 1 TsaB [Sphingopyxis sp.]
MIETTTAFLSVALFDEGALIAADHRNIGRGHAEQLVPTIAALPGGGKADAIWVGCGPGSFTGTRVGIAAARALAFVWGVELSGYDSLALVAAQARRATGTGEVAVASYGGHGQWLVAEAVMAWRALDPAEAAGAIACDMVAGACADELVKMRGFGVAVAAEADARAALDMDARARFTQIAALYARAPDAKRAS